MKSFLKSFKLVTTRTVPKNAKITILIKMGALVSSQTNFTEIKNVLSELIKSETQTIMLSKSSPEYMFKTIDRAIVPEFKLSPKRSIICIVGTLLGGFLALILALFRGYFRKTIQAV